MWNYRYLQEINLPQIAEELSATVKENWNNIQQDYYFQFYCVHKFFYLIDLLLFLNKYDKPPNINMLKGSYSYAAQIV